jgi:hypothetical protein
MATETDTFDTSLLVGDGDLPTFAAANGLRFEPTASAPSFGGALFDYLQDATVARRFASTSGRHFEVGNITGTVGGSQSRPASGGFTVTTSYSTTERREYGYLAMQLERALPHLVLDAQSNNSRFGGSSIPMPIAGGQRLSLEGDFDRHFRLHCPVGYERDALYVFTPDLMALLIDETGDFDVEIVDDHLFIYSTVPFNLADPVLWQRFARIRATVWAKAIRQTDAYADDRVEARAEPRVDDRVGFPPPTAGAAAPTVAEPGRRLKQGFLGGGTGRILWVVIGGFVVVLAVIGLVGSIVLNAVLPMFDR